MEDVVPVEGLVIVTAAGVDSKFINRFLLWIRDWESQDDDTWDSQRIIRAVDELKESQIVPDTPPIKDFTKSEFEGMAIGDVESLMLKNKKDIFMILDDKGVEEKTVILCERAIDYPKYGEASQAVDLDEFHKMRIPWYEISAIHMSLRLRVIDFDQYTTTYSSSDEIFDISTAEARHYWWTHRPMRAEFEKVFADLRDEYIRELEEQELA